nr:unnamed protein product [Spirometra erinaceieuropaei]
MAANETVSEAFRRVLYGHKFASYDALEEAIKRFSEETGYYFKPVNTHKFSAENPNAEKFVIHSRKYVCVLAPTHKREGCDAFFNIMHRRVGCLVVTSFRTEHAHEPVPVKPQRSEPKSPDSQLTDFHTLRPSSKTDEQTTVLCYLFKKIMRSGVYDSFDDLMYAVRKYEQASYTSFTRSRSNRLQSDHPRADSLKYRYVYFICSQGGVFRGAFSRTRSTSLKLGCTARFTAIAHEVGKRPQHTGSSGAPPVDRRDQERKDCLLISSQPHCRPPKRGSLLNQTESHRYLCPVDFMDSVTLVCIRMSAHIPEFEALRMAAFSHPL